jgi:FkbM family methyltransferase
MTINFNDVNARSSPFGPDRMLGRCVRWPLRFIPASTVLPILQGPGRGLKWIAGSFNHGCWLGSYDYGKQQILPKIIKRGDAVYDLGAHVGYFTIIFAKLVGPQGAVYAFEPVVENYRLLQDHVRLNRLSNVFATRAAIADRTGTGYVRRGWHSATGKLAEDGERCQVYSLPDFISRNHLRPPDVVKIDIEGAEAVVVPALLPYVRPLGARLVVSMHSDEIGKALVEMLSDSGYDVRPLEWARHPTVRRRENASVILASPA